MRPWIALPCGHSGCRAYVESIRRAGGRALLVPPGDLEAAHELVDQANGVLLMGGPDVDPARYGAPPHENLGKLDQPRDEVDFELLLAAMDAGKPVFGICRGQQVINVALGGSLYQDLPAEHPSEVTHRTPPDLGREHLAHAISVTPGSRLAGILGQTRLEVNSFHHQAVKDVAPGLRVSAVSDDGIVEGLESADGRIIAVQCHPEELSDLHRWAASLFQDLLRRAAG